VVGKVKYYGVDWMNNELTPAESFRMVMKMDEFILPQGFCFKITKELWKKLGGFNEKFVNGSEDCDLGFRAIEIGAKIGCIDFPMKHLHSQSEGRFKFADHNKKLFNSLWTKEKLQCLKNSSKMIGG
jgi:GT2 family glycosyltransferase